MHAAHATSVSHVRALADQPRPSTPRPSVRLFGSIRVEHGEQTLGVRDFGSVKAKQVLEILLAARGRAVPKDRLADMIWGENLPQNVSGALESYVSVARRRLGFGSRGGHRLIVTEPQAYRFAIDAVDLDLDRFDDFVRRADTASGAERRRLLEAAAELARGDVLDDEPYADWAEDLREEYRSRVLEVRVAAARAAMGEGDHAAAARHADAALAIEPLERAAVETAMLARYAAGREHDAARAFARYRDAAADYGIAPAADVVRLAESIAGDGALAQARLTTAPATSVGDDATIARLATIGAAVVELIGELEGTGPAPLPVLMAELRRSGSVQAALQELLATGYGAPAAARVLQAA
jgi:DNA-binding SARP family transcriptional activator